MNSILKRKCTKGSRSKHIKLFLTQNQETNLLQQKDYKELITFLEKHDYDKTYMDSKIKMTQTQCNIKKKTARKLKKIT